MKKTSKFFLKLFTFCFLSFCLWAANVYAQAKEEVFEWQMTRYPKAGESFKEDINKELEPRPEFQNDEELFRWQSSTYERSEESFKEEAEKELQPRPPLPTHEDTYKWQLEGYPKTKNIEQSLPEHN